MIRLGITGGIGSGKSTVTKLLSLMGIPVYIADIESKILTQNSCVIREKLMQAFGENLYKDGILDKKLLAQVIFTDKKRLEIANSIIHPEVDKHYVEWVSKQNDSPITALESAILYESKMVRYTDKVLLVYTPLENRIARTMTRDKISRDEVIDRINNQMLDEDKFKLADYVIYNDGSRSLICQTIDLLESLQKNTL